MHLLAQSTRWMQSQMRTFTSGGRYSAKNGHHDVFRCGGIDDVALQMRRRVQAGMAIEFVGSQLEKVCFHSFDFTNFLSISEQAMSNNNFIMFLHLGAVWWYQGFTRDHLLARHVTRISLDKPLSEVNAGEAVVCVVETGPWLRRLEFKPGPSGTRVPFGHLVQLGAIHVDEERGEVLDRGALDLLVSGHMHIAAEELIVDENAKRHAFIGDYEVTDLLQDDDRGAYSWYVSLPPLLQRPMRWRGSAALRNFGIAAMAMGVGSLVLWLPAGTIPFPHFLRGLLSGKPSSFKY